MTTDQINELKELLERGDFNFSHRTLRARLPTLIHAAEENVRLRKLLMELKQCADDGHWEIDSGLKGQALIIIDEALSQP